MLRDVILRLAKGSGWRVRHVWSDLYISIDANREMRFNQMFPATESFGTLRERGFACELEARRIRGTQNGNTYVSRAGYRPCP
jgi:hypothetical protein